MYSRDPFGSKGRVRIQIKDCTKPYVPKSEFDKSQHQPVKEAFPTSVLCLFVCSPSLWSLSRLIHLIVNLFIYFMFISHARKTKKGCGGEKSVWGDAYAISLTTGLGSHETLGLGCDCHPFQPLMAIGPCLTPGRGCPRPVWVSARSAGYFLELPLDGLRCLFFLRYPPSWGSRAGLGGWEETLFRPPPQEI